MSLRPASRSEALVGRLSGPGPNRSSAPSGQDADSRTRLSSGFRFEVKFRVRTTVPEVVNLKCCPSRRGLGVGGPWTSPLTALVKLSFGRKAAGITTFVETLSSFS